MLVPEKTQCEAINYFQLNKLNAFPISASMRFFLFGNPDKNFKKIYLEGKKVCNKSLKYFSK